MAWPDCVPGRISTAAGPSRVCTVSVVPSAAATIGIVTVQCRSSPWRSKIGCGSCTISRNRSPAGPPPGPVSPSPASWICVPSSPPAAIQVVALALEDRMRKLHDLKKQVPSRPAAGPGLALAGQLDMRPVLHTCRDPHLDGAPGPDPAVGIALRAWPADDRPESAALR